ncbi:hypothetical protein GGR57DRAFT_300514 [Xylariaceae sp. FL1272]|nr:hypothetical protein GGR57DRAFT_300514 [Xylariaceae sp. FL1272]
MFQFSEYRVSVDCYSRSQNLSIFRTIRRRIRQIRGVRSRSLGSLKLRRAFMSGEIGLFEIHWFLSSISERIILLCKPSNLSSLNYNACQQEVQFLPIELNKDRTAKRCTIRVGTLAVSAHEPRILRSGKCSILGHKSPIHTAGREYCEATTYNVVRWRRRSIHWQHASQQTSPLKILLAYGHSVIKGRVGGWLKVTYLTLKAYLVGVCECVMKNTSACSQRPPHASVVCR